MMTEETKEKTINPEEICACGNDKPVRQATCYDCYYKEQEGYGDAE